MPLWLKRRWFTCSLPLLFGAAVLLHLVPRPTNLPGNSSPINATSSDAEAKFRLGLRYLNGTVGEKNLDLALKWIRQAASDGCAEAQFLMGNFFAQGIGVEPDREEAIKWYSRAAVNGNLMAQYELEAPAFFPSVDRSADQHIFDPDIREVAPGEYHSDRFVFDIMQPIVKRRPDPPLPIRTDESWRINGTGFFITPQGHVVTCRHILSGAEVYQVGYENRLLPATLVAQDESRDLALLKVEGRFPAIPINFDHDKRPAETVYTIGFPNSEIQGLRPKLTQGIINSPTGFRDDPSEYQVSVSVQPGNSGGPLFDPAGRVVGVVTSRLDDMAILRTTGYLPQNVNYAIKSSVLVDFLKQQPQVMALLPKNDVSNERDLGQVISCVQSATVYIIADAGNKEEQSPTANLTDSR